MRRHRTGFEWRWVSMAFGTASGMLLGSMAFVGRPAAASVYPYSIIPGGAYSADELTGPARPQLYSFTAIETPSRSGTSVV